ncbi:MAG TPA: 3-isopropylmalate dehydratase small subunit [Gemmatimonadaceae bacterium]|nr:3-isopropylmalate dehydratase small subunit [Gemmatimonadaceae bacterium]
MDPITTFSATAVVLPSENVDTDQIIPARVLKTTARAGLGAHLFADWRYDADGSPRAEFILNRPESCGAHILVAGHNFGCGSSREHAPWALLDYGFRAIVSTRFADIFRNNALGNGLLPIAVDAEIHRTLVHEIERAPSARLTVDLASQSLTLPDGTNITFPIDPFAKHCLLHGTDPLGFLLGQQAAISAYEADHPARMSTV